MKAEELRIGNWVRHDPTRWSNRNETVDGLWDGIFQWEASDWYSIGECMLMLEDIEPIPLTEGFFLKNRFEKFEESLQCPKTTLKGLFAFFESEGSWTLHLWNMDACGWDDMGIKIEFVHQLQNLYYALTGEELQITF